MQWARVTSDDDFRDMVAYFWKEKGDPTRYVEWDTKRCADLMPDFYEAWSRYRTYQRLADDAAAREGARRG